MKLDALYGIGKGSLIKVLNEHAAAMRNQGLSPEASEQTAHPYRAGWSVARIGMFFA